MRAMMENIQVERPQSLTKLVRLAAAASVVTYLASLYYLWIILGGNGLVAPPVKISEPAFKPGVAHKLFNRMEDVLKHSEQLSSIKDSIARRDYICSALHQADLPCLQQSWKSSHTFKNTSGTNVYSLARTQRGTGAEAVLFAVNLRDSNAVAMLIAFAHFAKGRKFIFLTDQVFWVRNTHFVFVDGGFQAMDAFLSSYHLLQSSSVQAENLAHQYRGNVIAGVAFETQSKKTMKFEVKLNQINGQVPNLDLYTSIATLSTYVEKDYELTLYNTRLKDYATLGNLIFPLRAMYTQAFVANEGLHSVFSKYALQGLSVVLPANERSTKHASVLFMEDVARLLNSAEERLHQSYFMYILTSPSTFLSIAYYLPALAVLLPLLICAYSTWVSLQSFEIPIGWLIGQIYGFILWLGSTYIVSSGLIRTTAEWQYLIVALILPLGGLYSCKNPGSLRLVIYLQTALSMVLLGFFNVSLSLLSSIIAAPLILLLTRENDNWIRAFIRTAAAFIAHPFVLYVTFEYYARPLIFPEQKTSKDAFELVVRGLKRALEEHILLGNWLYALLCVIVVPLWNAVISLAIAPIYN